MRDWTGYFDFSRLFCAAVVTADIEAWRQGRPVAGIGEFLPDTHDLRNARLERRPRDRRTARSER